MSFVKYGSFLVLAAAVSIADASSLPLVAKSAEDPKDDPHNPLGYITNNAVTTVAFVLLMAVGILQTCFIFKWGAKWMMAMTIGIYCYTFGIGCRWALHTNPDSQLWLILENLFVILPPCAFIAAEYVLLGRLARFLHGDDHMLVSPQRVTKIFVISDIITLITQATGASSTISTTSAAKVKTGNDIFLGGLILQLISFFFFIVVLLRFLHRVHRHMPTTWARDAHEKWYNNWLSLAGALLLSCLCISVRCVYRVIEVQQGARGRLSTTEAYFYGLDTLPLWVAVAVYVPLWPGRFIRADRGALARASDRQQGADVPLRYVGAADGSKDIVNA